MNTPLLSVRDLVVDLFTPRSAVRPVDRVSYDVAAGETLAIVGESGSGKTVMNFAPLGLLPEGVVADLEGSVRFEGQELVGLGEVRLSRLRGRQISTIFQDPMTALNPARTIGRQLAEVTELHLGLTASQAEARALEMFRMVGISDPAARLRQYPHELSGGLCQRVMIAIAVAAEPKILIADEPTTALDVTVQAQILKLLKDLQRRLGMAMVLITHDIGVVAGSADRVAVMYAGRLAEQGPVEELLVSPRHPYTQGLISAIPREEDPVGAPFRGLPGVPPVLTRPAPGCAFAPRCGQALDRCSRERPVLRRLGHGATFAACHLLQKPSFAEEVA